MFRALVLAVLVGSLFYACHRQGCPSGYGCPAQAAYRKAMRNFKGGWSDAGSAYTSTRKARRVRSGLTFRQQIEQRRKRRMLGKSSSPLGSPPSLQRKSTRLGNNLSAGSARTRRGRPPKVRLDNNLSPGQPQARSKGNGYLPEIKQPKKQRRFRKRKPRSTSRLFNPKLEKDMGLRGR